MLSLVSKLFLLAALWPFLMKSDLSSPCLPFVTCQQTLSYISVTYKYQTNDIISILIQ